MKLENDILSLINLAVETSKLLSIEELIIDKLGIRALNPDRTAVLLLKTELPLPFESLSINRLTAFQQRLSIIKDVNDININAETDKDNNVRSLKFSNKNLSVSYRCANPNTISAPKNVSENFFRQVSFTNEAYDMLVKGQNAMKAEIFTLISDEHGVRFEIMDSNNDIFSYNFTNKVELSNSESSETFVFRYPIKIFLPVLKQNTNSILSIGEKGVLKMTVNDLDVMILPKK